MDVKPEDVFKTFSNSVEPSNRSIAVNGNNTLAEEFGLLSPIRNIKK